MTRSLALWPPNILVSLWFGMPHLAETIAGLGDKVVGAMVSNLLEILPVC
jgi:hypothetical protein